MRKNILDLTTFVAGILIISVSLYVGYDIIVDDDSTSEVETKERTVIITEDDSISSSIDEIYDATVLIEGYVGLSVSSSGTGFVYKTDEEYAYILTNNHVIESVNSVEVVYTDGSSVDAEFVGGDEYADIAVLKVPVDTIIDVAIIGDSTESEIGDTIFTVGTPIDSDYMNTVTKGIISGINRMVSVSINTSNDWILQVIQTDAAVNPGNSGGPLVNIYGEVIGINSLKLVESDAEGISFAIPIEDAIKYATIFESGEDVNRPLLGINTVSVDDQYSLYIYQLEVPVDIDSGVVVASVFKNSPAKDAGLEKGDIIISIDGVEVISNTLLKYYLYEAGYGSTVSIEYYRDGEILESEIYLNQIID